MVRSPTAKKALRFGLKSNTVKTRLTVAKNEIRDKARQKAEYDQAMALAPDSAENCNKRGRAKWSNKDLDGALVEFDRAIELDPNFGEAYGNRGLIRWNRGDLEGALADLNKALESIPDEPTFKEVRGFVKRALREKKGTAPKAASKKKKIPATENTVALRTDFSDEAAWEKLCAIIKDPDQDFQANVEFISDAGFAGVTAKKLPSLVSDESHPIAFIIDQTALETDGYPILVVDLQNEPGRFFRTIASELWAVENNLSIANMSFDEFACAADKNGIFRGFK